MRAPQSMMSPVLPRLSDMVAVRAVTLAGI